MSRISRSPDKQVIWWLISGCVLIYLMVVIGGLTRLTHSGLSITDWSFMGSAPPLSEKMWQERFEKYQQSPEFRKVNYNMSLEEFKPIFWWEYVHRMTGRLMMYVFMAGFIYFLARKKIRKEMWPGLILLFIMGAMQAVIGWWMVYSGLQKKPAVSHFRLAIHLMSALTLFAFTFWFTLRLIFRQDKSRSQGSVKLRTYGVVFFAVLIIQIVYGAFTAGYVENDNVKLRPGHIFNTWPKMGDSWMPEQVLMKDSLYENLLMNASGIQFMHRTIAWVLVLVLLILWRKANRLNLLPRENAGITLIIYGVTIQFILGVLTLIYNVPVVMGALHQSGAFFLFACSLYLLFQLFNNYKPADGTES